MPLLQAGFCPEFFTELVHLTLTPPEREVYTFCPLRCSVPVHTEVPARDLLGTGPESPARLERSISASSRFSPLMLASHHPCHQGSAQCPLLETLVFFPKPETFMRPPRAWLKMQLGGGGGEGRQ